MNCGVATARNARNLVRHEGGHRRHAVKIRLEVARTCMAVQALRVVVRAVQMDHLGGTAHILHVNVPQALELVLQGTVHGVVRVAGVAGLIRLDEVVLKMLRGDVALIQHVQTLPVGFHAVARNAVCRLFGTLHVKGHARGYA